MAIIIEEEKNRSGILRILGWIVILCLVIAAIYYVFFAAPQLVIIAPSGNLSTITPIVQSDLSPTTVLNSPAFRALNPAPPSAVVSTSTNSPGGRPNPFIAP